MNEFCTVWEGLNIFCWSSHEYTGVPNLHHLPKWKMIEPDWPMAKASLAIMMGDCSTVQLFFPWLNQSYRCEYTFYAHHTYVIMCTYIHVRYVYKYMNIYIYIVYTYTCIDVYESICANMDRSEVHVTAAGSAGRSPSSPSARAAASSGSSCCWVSPQSGGDIHWYCVYIYTCTG